MTNVVDASPLIEFECLELLGATYLSSHLVLHVLVGLRVLIPLILIGEAEFLQSVNLLLDSVVLSRRNGTVQLAVVGLEESSVEDILRLALSQLTLE